MVALVFEDEPYPGRAENTVRVENDDAVFRLKTFVDRAAISTLTGDIFDDAATGQGLLNFEFGYIESRIQVNSVKLGRSS